MVCWKVRKVQCWDAAGTTCGNKAATGGAPSVLNVSAVRSEAVVWSVGSKLENQGAKLFGIE